MGKLVVQRALKPGGDIDMGGPPVGMQWLKEPQPLNVVCVPMRNEEMAGAAFRQIFTAQTQAGARIKNEKKPVVCAQLNTRGVAAIKRHGRRRRGDAAAHAPEHNFHVSLPAYSIDRIYIAYIMFVFFSRNLGERNEKYIFLNKDVMLKGRAHARTAHWAG